MDDTQQTFVLYTDGGARGNPGPSGAGAVIYSEEGKCLKEVSEFLGEQTNNWAEYEAVYLGLQALKKLVPKERRKEAQVIVNVDSELIARQLSGQYQVKEETLFAQYIKVHNMRVADFPHVVFEHVRREHNKEADRLANEAMDTGA